MLLVFLFITLSNKILSSFKYKDATGYLNIPWHLFVSIIVTLSYSI